MMQVFLDRARENNSRTMRAPNGQHDRWSGGGQGERDIEKEGERGIVRGRERYCMCRQLLTFAHVSLHELAADHADECGVRSIGHGPG